VLRRKIRPPLTQLVKHRVAAASVAMTRLRQVQDFRYLVGAKRIKQNAGRVDSARPQLRERVKPLPRIFVQQQIKVGRDGIVLDYMSGKHATMRS
jgi:hypothetical protein